MCSVAEQPTIFFVNKYRWLDASPMATVSTQSAYYLAQAGARVHFLIRSDDPCDTDAVLREKFGLEPTPNLTIETLRPGRLSASLGFFAAANRYILHHGKRGDAVYSRNTNYLWWMWLLKLRGFKTYFEAHGYHGDGKLSGMPARKIVTFAKRWSAYRITERLLLNRLSGLVCITAPQAQLYQRDFVKVPIAVLPLGANPAHKPEASELPQRDHRRLVFVGRPWDYIDYEVVLHALQRDATLRFAWLGLKPEQLERVRYAAAELGVSDRVELHGWMAHGEMMDWMRRNASVGLVIYRATYRTAHVISPTKAFDYLSAGLPVICSNLPTMAPLATEHEAGAVYAPGDAVSFAGAVEAVIGADADYKRLQQGALRAADAYGWPSRSTELLKFMFANK